MSDPMAVLTAGLRLERLAVALWNDGRETESVTVLGLSEELMAECPHALVPELVDAVLAGER